MKKSTLIILCLGIVIGIIAYKLLWTVAQPKIAHRVAQISLTDNEKAANGPLPGDVSLCAKELAAQQEIPTPGYYSSLNAAEITDAQRSGMFPAATFLGSWDGSNKVFAWRSEDDYQATAYINNRKPGELYIAGGANPPLKGEVPAGPFVAKADATTGKQIWRTYLDNANASGNWLAAVNLNILPNGQIVFAWENSIALLDGDTGRILKRTTLPTGDTSPTDSNYKHVTIAPDGTIIAKNQTLPSGYVGQGTLAIIKGVLAGCKQPNSHLVALDPKTLEILDHVPLPEPVTVPHIITMFEGKTAIYLGAPSGAFRYFWDPAAKKLSQDTSWLPKPLAEGQSTPDAPSLLHDWIILQANGIGSKTTASSIIAVHQKDAARTKVIYPFGPLEEGEFSNAPPKPQTDPENNMIYSADFGVNKVAGIKFDPETGDMVCTVPATSNATGFPSSIATPSNCSLALLSRPGVTTAKRIDMRSLLTPGYGGRVYYSSGKGFITLQVMPAQAASSPSTE
ncbi:MAG: PQQ-like beta-propeller repeat protein [Verrucomicrobia bacterium]|nr:PQQ-like beta-propeller repeat protein [Verrucomicrobiota bacterium]